ncbi:hypothetical protein [Streptomyces sp. NPDC017529]|uniref:bestrophin-like domain n=1 Tax=Streptomyces sp. NPDC017529 TaxID=3365000 RepID=UPI0037B48394
MLMVANDSRAKTRQARLAESARAVPWAVYWFMLVLLSIAIVSLCLCIPRRHNRPRLAALTMVTALLTVTLLLVHGAERPFGGAISVDSAIITDVEHQAIRAFGSDSPGTELPCDTHGRKEAKGVILCAMPRVRRGWSAGGTPVPAIGPACRPRSGAPFRSPFEATTLRDQLRPLTTKRTPSLRCCGTQRGS